jgi:hypothetical protein
MTPVPWLAAALLLASTIIFIASAAMMVVIAVWMMALIETHVETRLIPSYFLHLVFWSCVMTNVIASLAGILLACRRA